MHMLYNSDHFAVVQIEVEAPNLEPSEGVQLTRGGYEIVDKFARKEIFLEGAMAERFKDDVNALIESSPTEEDIDAYLAGYASLAQHPVLLH